MSKVRVELPLLIAVFLDLFGFGMVLVNFQFRAERLIPDAWPQGLVIGALLSSTFVTQILVSPRWGASSDRIGRKPIIVVCTILSGLGMVVYGLAGSLIVLLASRLLSGLGAANVAVAQALISDTYEGEARTAALGRMGAAVSAGLVVGPGIGGFLAHYYGGELIGLVAGGASLLGALWLFMVLPNPPPKHEQRPGKLPAIDIRLLRELPALRPLVLIAVVAWFSLATLEGTFLRLINRLFGYTEYHFGLLFSYESLLAIGVQGLLLVAALKFFRETPLLRIAYVAQGLGLALNPLAVFFLGVEPLVILFIASTLFAIGAGLANPTVNSLCSRLTPEDRQGELFGLLQGARSIGFILGPPLGGVLFDWYPAAPYFMAGGVCVVAAFLVPTIDSSGRLDNESRVVNAV